MKSTNQVHIERLTAMLEWRLNLPTIDPFKAAEIAALDWALNTLIACCAEHTVGGCYSK